MGGRREKTTLIWHPDVHSRFRENLLYYLLRVHPYTQVRFEEEFAAFAKEAHLDGYCLYPTYGTYDVLLRIWLPPQEEAIFSSRLRQRLKRVRHITPFRTSERAHWCWESGQGIEKSVLDKVTADEIRQVQKGPGTIRQKYTEAGLLQNAPGSSWIKFYTAIGIPDGVTDDQYNKLMESIWNALSSKGARKFQRSSIYKGYGFAQALVKSEAKDYHAIWAIVEEINELLEVVDGFTITQLVAAPSCPECDFISEASLHEMETMDAAVNAVFPELYEYEGLEVDRRREIEGWIHKKVIGQGFDDIAIVDIRRVLAGVALNSDEDVLAAMIRVFARAEKELRARRGRFMGNHFDSKEQRELLRLAKVDAHKNLKLLTLGHLLSIYSHGLERLPVAHEQGTKDVLHSWEAISELRNKLAHGEADPLSGWEENLSLFVDFIRRLHALVRIIDQTLAD